MGGGGGGGGAGGEREREKFNTNEEGERDFEHRLQATIRRKYKMQHKFPAGEYSYAIAML